MKTLPLFAAFALLLGSARAEPESPPPAPPATAADSDETELDGKMSAMSGAFKKLRRQIADPAANASSLELVAKLLRGAEASATLSPEKTATLPEAEREKFVADYAAQMQAFIEEVKKLESALQAGDNTAAAASLKLLGDLQKKGHRTFRLPENH